MLFYGIGPIEIFQKNILVRWQEGKSAAYQMHESRQIGSGQTGDGKSECRHSRNQRTQMDWNG